MIPYSEIAAELKRRGVKKAALQFPEGLKRFAPELVSVLRKEGITSIISGDPCWGACDLSLDAASDADILVHIGHTPVTDEKMSSTSPTAKISTAPFLKKPLQC